MATKYTNEQLDKMPSDARNAIFKNDPSAKDSYTKYIRNMATPNIANVSGGNPIKSGAEADLKLNNANYATLGKAYGSNIMGSMNYPNGSIPTANLNGTTPLYSNGPDLSKYSSSNKDDNTNPNLYGSGSYRTGAGGSGYVSGYANFTPSDTYNKAMEYTNQLLAQLSSGRTSYTDQINQMMDAINNRASFSYDPDNDPLFQNYLASAMNSGQTAMRDTIGQASALTGGYGSTYATAAANGAYNNYIQDAYNNLPEYYNSALDAYNSETANLYNKLGMYRDADDTEYGRLNNAYGLNSQYADSLYNKEYANYWDTTNYNTNLAEYNADLAYKYASLAQDEAQFNASMAAKNSSSSSGGSSNDADLNYTEVNKEIKQAAETYGRNSDEVANLIATYANDYGYDINRLMNYANSFTDVPANAPYWQVVAGAFGMK